MNKFKSFLTLLLCFGLIFFYAVGCEEQIIEPIEEDSGIYSFYGTLRVGESPNYVRVRNLNEPFLAASDAFDGTVIFQNMESGQTSTLRDTIIRFGQNYTHNFIIEDEIEHDNKYLIKAVRSDGLESQSTAKAPNSTTVELFPSSNIECRTDITFIFGNVLDNERIDMNIAAYHNGQRHDGDLSIFINELEYFEEADEYRMRVSPRNLLVEVFTPKLPDNPYFDPFRLSPTVTCSELDTNQLEITYTHFGPEWSTGRPFRGPIDIESGVVENGLGFFGALSEGTFSITLN